MRRFWCWLVGCWELGSGMCCWQYLFVFGLYEVLDYFQLILLMLSRLVWVRLNRDNCVFDVENFYLQICFVGKFGLREIIGEDGNEGMR